MSFDVNEENAGADDPHGLDKRLTYQEPEEEEIDWDSIPQGKPEGQRLGGGAEPEQRTCETCRGTGSYEVSFFAAPDPVTGERKLGHKNQRCVVCEGTGVETVMAR